MKKLYAYAAAAAMLGILAAVNVWAGAGSQHASSGGSISVSHAFSYDSLAEMRRASTAVVVVVPLSSSVSELNGLPITQTTVRVKSVLSGSIANREIVIQQLGSSTVSSPDTSPLLRHGGDYALFVEPFHLVPGDSTGLYVITGDQGIFESKNGKYRNVGRDSKLPATLDVHAPEIQ